MEIKDINLSCKIKAKSKHMFSEVENEAVLLDLEEKKYFGLNEVGLRIYELSKDAITVQSIVEKIADEFEVDKDICMDDCLSFIQIMVKKNLIEII